jgi:Flp pilus assembly protein TadD
LEGQVHSLQGEVATLLAEVERLAVSIQLTIARQLEPDGIKPEQLVSAGQALVSSRVAIASLLARREETAGRWEAASSLWQRASRARPGEVLLLVNAANALRKAGTDLTGAETLARQAIALDPDNAEAHAALAIIESRRRAPT